MQRIYLSSAFSGLIALMSLTFGEGLNIAWRSSDQGRAGVIVALLLGVIGWFITMIALSDEAHTGLARQLSIFRIFTIGSVTFFSLCAGFYTRSSTYSGAEFAVWAMLTFACTIPLWHFHLHQARRLSSNLRET